MPQEHVQEVTSTREEGLKAYLQIELEKGGLNTEGGA